MHWTTPQVFLLARTVSDRVGLADFLNAVGVSRSGIEHHTDPAAMSGGERIIEIAGRACYRSFEVGLNPNVTRVRQDSAEYFGNILKSGHGSVLEHATVTFGLVNVSRVFTHEIVRHRTGTAFSQESLRFVRLEDLGFWMPQVFRMPRHRFAMRFIVRAVLAVLERVQRLIAKRYDLDETNNFRIKKVVTSAMRRLAPIGLSTNIVITANHRAWRHMIEMRTSEHAEEELRTVMHSIAKQLRDEYPLIYQDMRIDGKTVTFDNPKV